MVAVRANEVLVDDAILASGKKLRFRQLGDRLSALRRNDRYPTMTSPPTITYGTSTSTVDATKLGGSATWAANSDRFVHAGSVFVDGLYGGSVPLRVPSHITLSTAAKTSGAAPIRVRFMTDAPTFDVVFSDRGFGMFDLIVDGEMAYRSKPVTFTVSGNARYINVNFGSNTTTYSRVQTTLGVLTGGTGYAVGDIITAANAASGTAMTVKVTQVSSGAVTAVDIVNPGAYTSLPTGTFTQGSTTGSGSGWTSTASFFSKNYSSRKMRRIEVVYQDPIQFMGIVTVAGDIVLPWPVSASLPKLCVLGDSITAGTYLEYIGGQPAVSMAQELGLHDTLVISAQGGTGWNQVNSTALQWSAAARIADIIALAPDILVTVGSQNDTSGATLTGLVTSTLNAYLAALPNLLIVGTGPVLGGSTAISTNIASGYAAASDQSRVRYIDNQTPHQWLNPTYSATWSVSGDGNHLGQQGQDMFGKVTAELVFQALMDMCS